jgi:hypothetical protein
MNPRGVWFYRLDVETCSLIKETFGSAISRAEESFWDDCKPGRQVAIGAEGQSQAVSNEAKR